MSHDSSRHSCSEYNRISRRTVLGGMSAAAIAATMGVSWLPRAVFGEQVQSGRDVLVFIYLRGGIDGLTLCYPHGDARYYAARPTLALPQPGSGQTGSGIDLDGYFGMPAQFSPLVTAYQNQHLLFLHAVGAANWSRSHFDAQRWMEVGRHRDHTVASGWIGRHLASVRPLKVGSVLRGMSMTHGLTQTLFGAPQTLAIPDPDEFGFAGTWSDPTEMAIWIDRQYRLMGDATSDGVRTTRRTMSVLDRIGFANYSADGGATYPNSDFGYAIKCAAALIKADVGIEAIHIDVEGWDTHANQGTISGFMANKMNDLASGLAAFYQDMSAADRMNWTAVGMSEFGRGLHENSSQGTDHGTGNAMFLLGANVLGGRVVRDWPGLADGQLLDGIDVRPTIDYRDVLAEVAQKRLGTPDVGIVFPGHSARFRGLVN